MCRCHHRKLAGRHITSNRLNRNIPVAKDHTRHRFDLDILHRCALDFGKFAHLILCKANVIHIAR